MAKLPTSIMEAFRASADRDLEAVACLLIDDGFNAETMRVLAAWPQVELGWENPGRKCPGDGAPTPAAWRWLVEGIRMDAGELATIAGVSRAVAREKSEMLLGNRLVFPDGSLAKPARASLQRHAREALGLKPPKPPPSRPEPRDDGTN